MLRFCINETKQCRANGQGTQKKSPSYSKSAASSVPLEGKVGLIASIRFSFLLVNNSRKRLTNIANKKEVKQWFNALGRSTPFGGTKFNLICSITFGIMTVKQTFIDRQTHIARRPCAS